MKILVACIIAVGLAGGTSRSMAQDIATDSPNPDNKKDKDVEEVVEVSELPPGALWNPDMFPSMERAANLLTTQPVRPKALLVSIDHRAFQRFTRQTFKDWFGLDAGSLKIGIGFRYGVLPDLDVGFLRLNGTEEVFDVYQVDARYRLLRQDSHWINLAFRGGITWFYQPDVLDAVGYWGQLLIDRTFMGRLTTGVGLLFHSDSSGAYKSNLDPEYSLALAAWAEVRFLSFLAWSLEAALPMSGYSDHEPGKDKLPALSMAVKFITSRHVFSLILSNTQYISADGIVAGSYRDLKNLILGFSIIREIDF